jgi:transposase
MTCNFSVAFCDHVDRFGRSPTAPVPIICVPGGCATHFGTTNSGMETKHNHQGILHLFLPQKNTEKAMITRFHGIDKHKKYSTISVLNRKGEEVEFKQKCFDLKKYIENLGSEDAVVIESSTGAFCCADQVESKGALCYVIDPRKFKIIRDSWNKTDKQDARNMVKALWIYIVTGEFGIPTVYKPDVVIRALRKLFSQYQLLNRQIRMLKNNIQAIVVDNGITLTKDKKNALLLPKYGKDILKRLELPRASDISIRGCLELLWRVKEEKEKIRQEIILAGEPLKEAVKLLITIKGITPLTALAFLADVGDIRRFKTQKKMSAYLGLVPKVKDSGGKSKSGHINRESRKLTRTILTQSIYHVSNASPVFRKFYVDLTEKRGAGRARIALIRKLCGIMRSMLMTGECYRWMDDELFAKKLKIYEKELGNIKMERKTA